MEMEHAAAHLQSLFEVLPHVSSWLDKGGERIGLVARGKARDVRVRHVPDSIDPCLTVLVHPPQLRDGDPIIRTTIVQESADGQLSVGVWDCSGGRFARNYRGDEAVHVLSGKARVEVGEEVYELKEGSICFFPARTRSEWTVPHYVKTVFFRRRGLLENAVSM